MFIDVCFPDKNEASFIEIAKKLGTDGLCFVYPDKRSCDVSSSLKIYNASSKNGKYLFSSNLNLNQKNVIYYYEPQSEKKSFHSPLKEITQVTMNSIAERSGIFGISFHQILRIGNFEEIAFTIKLARKANVPIFIASFGRTPYSMRDCKTLRSIINLICSHSDIIVNSTNVLDQFLSK
ncbi:MAG: hypothetical protein ABIJ34_00390 [archaeon]